MEGKTFGVRVQEVKITSRTHDWLTSRLIGGLLGRLK